MKLVKSPTPMVKIIQVDKDPMKLKNGATATGWYAADPFDDRYWEKVVYPDGSIQYFQLVDEDEST